jgi:L-iditol 2-dehydrogenase
MKAAIFYDKEDMRIDEIDDPKITDDEVLIKVEACGVCGTDARVYYQGIEKRWKVPIIMGHEVAGRIVRVGENSSGFSINDRVTVAPICGCGTCSFCLAGKENLCREAIVIGANYDGGYAEYMKIPRSYVRSGGLVKIPDRLTYEEATFAEPVSCCLHGIKKANIEPGDTVVVIGDGPIGIIHSLLARAFGAARIIVSGHNNKRLGLAKELGADLIINSKGEDVIKEVLDATDGNGAERVIVAVGSIQAVEQGIKMLKDGGAIVIFGQYAEPNAILELNPDLFNFSEITVTGSVDATLEEFYRSVSLLKALNLRRIITHRFPLESIVDAMRTVKGRECSKVIIKLD